MVKINIVLKFLNLFQISTTPFWKDTIHIFWKDKGMLPTVMTSGKWGRGPSLYTLYILDYLHFFQ